MEAAIASAVMYCPPTFVWEQPPPCRDLALSGYTFATMVECEDHVRNPPDAGRFYCAEMVRFE